MILYVLIVPNIPVDWGWASGRIRGDSSLDIGGTRYPEIYWVGETSKECNNAKSGVPCTCAESGTDYCTYRNDVNKLLASSGPIDKTLKSFSSSNQNNEAWVAQQSWQPCSLLRG